MDKVEQRKRAFFGKKFSFFLNNWKKMNRTTQRDFCEEAGVSKNIVKAWKDGLRFPREAQMDKICEVFGVDRRVFYPLLPFEEDRVANSVTQSRSQQLQQYADKNGLKEEFYQYVTHDPDFLHRFPFHRKDWFWNNPPTDTTEEERFDLVKFQFEDDAGHRFMLTEEDIDFLIRVQKKSREWVDYQMFREKQDVHRKWVEYWVDIYLEHIKVDREEVLRRLFAFDLTRGDRRITEKMIADTVLQVAKENGVNPQYTKEDIIAMFPPDNQEYIRTMEKVNRYHGVSEEQIRKVNREAEEQRRSSIRKTIELYRAMGLLIENDKVKTEG